VPRTADATATAYRRNDGVEFKQGFAAHRLGLARQKSPLSVGEPDSLSSQPFFEQLILGLEKLDDEQLMPMDPARHNYKQKRQQWRHRTHANSLSRPRSNCWTVRGPAAENGLGIVPAELAATILRTLNLPEIAQVRPRLLPECRVYGRETSANGEILISGTADAVALKMDETIDVVIDWKSDVELDAGKLNAYRGQLEAYRKATGASRTLLVLMTSGKVIEFGALAAATGSSTTA
jgi:hypothetical protein